MLKIGKKGVCNCRSYPKAAIPQSIVVTDSQYFERVRTPPPGIVARMAAEICKAHNHGSQKVSGPTAQARGTMLQ